MIDVVLPKPHAAQRAIEDNALRFNVIVAGRRFDTNQPCLP